MALDFGKGNRSIAFNPTSAFPLDARSYFESYEEAAAAALTAVEAGSADSVYYFGQQLIVVEDDIVNLYIIQTDGTLGEAIRIDTNVFEFDNNGELNLIGYKNAEIGYQLVKGADGKLSWIKPDTDTITGLGTELNTLKTNLETNYYTKTQTEEKIAEAAHLKRKKISSLDEIDLNAADVDSYIYMLPSGLQDEDNKYDEYIVIITEVIDEEGIVVPLKEIEKVGTWEVDLSEYAKASELEKKVDKIDGHVLISQAELNKLATVKSYAEPNFINVVNTNQFSVVGGKLDLNLELLKIEQKHIEGLLTRLKAIENNLFTEELQKKLTKVINDVSEMSSKVGSLDKIVNGYTDGSTGQEVAGLSQLMAVANTNIAGLQQKANEHDGKLATLERTVYGYTDENDSEVAGLDTRVESLENQFSQLDNKYVTISQFNTVVGNMDDLFVRQKTIIEEIDDIKEQLIWGEIASTNS